MEPESLLTSIHLIDMCFLPFAIFLLFLRCRRFASVSVIFVFALNLPFLIHFRQIYGRVAVDRICKRMNSSTACKSKESILELLHLFGVVALPADLVTDKFASSVARVAAIRDSHCAEGDAGTAVSRVCVEEGCLEEIFLGVQFSRLARPSLLELVEFVRRECDTTFT